MVRSTTRLLILLFALIPVHGTACPLGGDGVKNCDRLTVVAIADAHIKNDHALERFATESMPDVRRTMEECAAFGPVIGISLGDQLSDNMDRAGDVKKLLDGFYYCIGNHDHNSAAGNTEEAVTEFYRQNFSPTDYSFDMGKVHFVVMDDIQYTGIQRDGIKISYTTGFTDSQLEWLRNDIARVQDKDDKAVVLCIHSPLFGRFTHKDEVKALLEQFGEAHVLSGHEHNINNVWLGDKIWEHNIQSIAGAWWYSNLSPNGSPLGYLVLQFENGRLVNEYNKATNCDEAFQMRVYDGNDSYGPDTYNPINEDIKRTDKVYAWPENCAGQFVVRIWDGTRDWDVKFVQNGVETPMKQISVKMFDCATAAYMTDVHGAPFGGSGAYRPTVDSFWTLPAPCGDPAEETGWEIVATHKEPSGYDRVYRCSHLQRDYRGFAAIGPDSRPAVPELVHTLRNSSCQSMTRDRLWAMYQMQEYMDSTTNDSFEAYLELENPAERRKVEKEGVLYFYQESLEKLVREIPATNVAPGTVAVWLLYNMGYVVKTPSHCFAIDLKHPEACRLVPFLDFLMITHDHDDHYTDRMNKAMTDAGKKVYSNFDSPYCPLTNLRDVREVDLGDIKIRTELTDHNKEKRQFVITYQIDCGADTGHTVIYHVGDSCYYEQLNPSQPVDIFIPHLQVGLKMDKAVAKIQPNWVLVSHLLELGHRVDRYRWPYVLGLNVAHETHRENAFVPVWGEKLVYVKTDPQR